jgi:hypothetical protein
MTTTKKGPFSLRSWIGRNTRRVIALALAPGLLGLAFEAGVGHFAGDSKAGAKDAQYFPVYFGMAGFLILVIGCLIPKRKIFNTILRVVGALSFVMGLLGTYYHLASFIEDLADKTIDSDVLQDALGSAPPAFAPMAFALFGVILWALASKNVLLRFRVPGGKRKKQRAGAPATDESKLAGRA